MVIWAVLALLSLVPFLFTPLPPLNDYPSHLARAHVIASLQGTPELQTFYAVEWRLVPNLALDLLVPPLARFMPIQTAMIAFTVASLLILSSGVLVLNHALFGQPSLAPFAVFIILFNRQFLWGFVSYLFTLGLCLWIFAAWVRYRPQRNLQRIAMFSLASFILFLFHLHAFATYAVLVAGYELYSSFGAREGRTRAAAYLAIAAIQFIPPGVVLLFVSPTADRAADFAYGGLTEKVTGLLDAFYAYSIPLDALTMLTVTGLAAAGLLTRTLVIDKRMLVPLATLAAFYIVMPGTLFGSFAADRRLATSVYIILAGSMHWPFNGTRAAHAAALVLLALITVRVGVAAYRWREAGEVYRAYLAAFEMVPHGSRVAAAVAKTISPFLEEPPVMYISSMAVVSRNAFVISLFAEHGHQPLSLRYRPRDVQGSRMPHIFFVQQKGTPANWRAPDPFKDIDTEEYDFVLLINPGYFGEIVPASLN